MAFQTTTPIPSMQELEAEYYRLWASIMEPDVEEEPTVQQPTTPLSSVGALIYQHTGLNTQRMVTQQQQLLQQQQQALIDAEKVRLVRLAELAKQRQQQQQQQQPQIRHRQPVRTRY